MESMEQVFDQCQQHEVKRLTFLKEALLDIKRHLNLTENQRLEQADGSRWWDLNPLKGKTQHVSIPFWSSVAILFYCHCWMFYTIAHFIHLQFTFVTCTSLPPILNNVCNETHLFVHRTSHEAWLCLYLSSMNEFSPHDHIHEEI